MKFIKGKSDRLISLIIKSNDLFKPGLDFLTNENEFIQVGTWNYEKDRILPRHYHNEVDRISNKTNELIIIKKGSIEAYIYDNDQMFIETVILEKNDVAVFFDGGHGYKILEDNTNVLEVKNGPYPGNDIDRTRF